MKLLVSFLSLLWISIPILAQHKANYTNTVEQWHTKRIQELKKEDGWLNLEGLFWLHKGINTFGSAKENDCFYDNTSFPKYVGDFIVEGDSVVWLNKISNGVNISGEKMVKGNKRTIYKWNGEKEQSVEMTWNRIKWVVIKREDKIGIRCRNLDAKTLTHFPGIKRFPVDQQWKIKAILEKPQENILMIANVLGQVTAQKNAGKLKFELNGIGYSLDVIDEDGKTFYITFADATSGKTTYGAGRFIVVNKPDANGNTEIDFNLAYNPPCAFTNFATCPLPPPQNRLSIAITAGEKKLWTSLKIH